MAGIHGAGSSNNVTGASFFTVDTGERQFLLDNPAVGYTGTGVAFYAFANPGDNLDAVVRYRHTDTGGHVLSSSIAERTLIDSTFADPYEFEGIKFYAYPADLLI